MKLCGSDNHYTTAPLCYVTVLHRATPLRHGATLFLLLSISIIYMYSYTIRMSLVCTRMSSLCHSYVAVCNDMTHICTRMPSVCHSYLLVCHSYVNNVWFYNEPCLRFSENITEVKKLFYNTVKAY